MPTPRLALLYHKLHNLSLGTQDYYAMLPKNTQIPAAVAASLILTTILLSCNKPGVSPTPVNPVGGTYLVASYQLLTCDTLGETGGSINAIGTLNVTFSYNSQNLLDTIVQNGSATQYGSPVAISDSTFFTYQTNAYTEELVTHQGGITQYSRTIYTEPNGGSQVGTSEVEDSSNGVWSQAQPTVYYTYNTAGFCTAANYGSTAGQYGHTTYTVASNDILQSVLVDGNGDTSTVINYTYQTIPGFFSLLSNAVDPEGTPAKYLVNSSSTSQYYNGAPPQPNLIDTVYYNYKFSTSNSLELTQITEVTRNQQALYQIANIVYKN